MRDLVCVRDAAVPRTFCAWEVRVACSEAPPALFLNCMSGEGLWPEASLRKVCEAGLRESRLGPAALGPCLYIGARWQSGLDSIGGR